MNWTIFIEGMIVIMVLATLTWMLSVYLKDVSIVDSIWSLMFLAAAIYYYVNLSEASIGQDIFFIVVLIWSARLAIHLTWRNWGEPEDRRYQDIRKKYSPNFALKSFPIIFVFQAVLAIVISLPIVSVLGAESRSVEFSMIQYLALAIWLAGFLFESIADWQLSSFKNDPGNAGKVMNKGLWRFSRHPNYFGEFLIWWGFYLFAFNTAPWWIIVSPILMSWLLLKFSGVVMLEETIVNRRPKYQQYIESTNAFFPGKVKA